MTKKELAFLPEVRSNQIIFYTNQIIDIQPNECVNINLDVAIILPFGSYGSFRMPPSHVDNCIYLYSYDNTKGNPIIRLKNYSAIMQRIVMKEILIILDIIYNGSHDKRRLLWNNQYNYA